MSAQVGWCHELFFRVAERVAEQRVKHSPDRVASAQIRFHSLSRRGSQSGVELLEISHRSWGKIGELLQQLSQPGDTWGRYRDRCEPSTPIRPLEKGTLGHDAFQVQPSALMCKSDMSCRADVICSLRDCFFFNTCTCLISLNIELHCNYIVMSM